jgi:hypothetical protein
VCNVLLFGINDVSALLVQCCACDICVCVCVRVCVFEPFVAFDDMAIV